MRTNLLLVLWLLLGNGLWAQTFPLHVIEQTGPLGNRINVVFLPDGYTQDEMNAFRIDCRTFQQAFLAQQPFAAYRQYLNFFSIEVPSAESGVSHPGTAGDEGIVPNGTPVGLRKTYFGVSMDCSGIHRYMCLSNVSGLYAVLAANVPDYDLVVVLSNTGAFGGGGYPVAIVSGHNSLSTELALHEIGHTFGALADEYWIDSSTASERPNMTRNANPSTIKWKAWLKAGAGIYGHTGDESWKKPANQTCKMELLGNPYCVVCREAITDRILTLVSPVDQTIPSTNEFLQLDYTCTIRLGLVLPSPNTLRIDWSINGEVVARNVDSLVVTPSRMGFSNGQVTAAVLDTTGFNRLPTHPTAHLRTFTWSVQLAGCPLNLSLRDGNWGEVSTWSCGRNSSEGISS